MKSTIFLYISLFIFLHFFIIINSKKETIKENKEKETTEEENKEEKEEETSESKEKEAEGHMMTDEEFEEKLQEILKEKRIRKNMKITKDKLKEIFEIIYEKDFTLPDLPEDLKKEREKEEDDKIDVDPKEESKRFLNEIFFKLARSLDYDDEISPDQIKEYISPKRVQVVVGEIVENLIGMMGDL